MEGAVPEGYKVITEGQAHILYQTCNETKSGVPVFYNPVQEFNRDISVLILNTFAKHRQVKHSDKEAKFEVLEALAATGLRSIRFIKEVPAITKIVINDFDPNAIKAAKKNLEYNQIDLSKVQLENKDANVLMQEAAASSKPFDVIDLDPYGTAIDFLDAAIRALKQNGSVSSNHRTAVCDVHGRSSAVRVLVEGRVLRALRLVFAPNPRHARGRSQSPPVLRQPNRRKVQESRHAFDMLFL